MNDYALQLVSCFDIGPDGLDSLEVIRKDDGMHIAVTLRRIPAPCPACGCTTARVANYVDKTIRHSILSTGPCFIDYHARRFRCPSCGKTFYEHSPFTFDGMKISAATVFNVLQDLKNPHETFSSVADRYHISATEVIRIFDAHVSIPRKKLPEVISIDECYALPNDESKYICVLLDFRTQQIIDILPSRKKKDLVEYFSKISRTERLNVKITSADLWFTYRDISHMFFPNAHHAADRFHILQEFSKSFSGVRIRCMNQSKRIKDHFEKERRTRPLAPDEASAFDEAKQKYYLLKKFNWIFHSRSDEISNPNARKKYNTVMREYLNLYDIHLRILESYPELDEASILMDELYAFYESNDIDGAAENIDSLIKDFRTSSVKEMVHFAGTLAQWKNEIINSFELVEGKRVNNSRIEGVNKKIKQIKFNSNGYRSFERMRNRILYCINSEAHYVLESGKMNKKKEK